MKAEHGSFPTAQEARLGYWPKGGSNESCEDGQPTQRVSQIDPAYDILIGAIDGTRGSGLPFAGFPLDLQMGNTGLQTGPSLDASWAILQSDLQAKYDVSKILRSHIIRYGIDLNRIGAAGFAPAGALAPSLITNVGASEEAFAQTGAAGQINGTTPQGHYVNRVGVNTGVYSLGAPRQIEFGLRLTFYAQLLSLPCAAEVVCRFTGKHPTPQSQVDRFCYRL